MVNFDEEINRIGTNSSKYDNMEKLFGIPAKGSLSMWTADMDFKAAECILAAIRELSEHGVLGYYGNKETYDEAVKNWYKIRHGWEIGENCISVVHGLVSGIGLAIQAFSKEGDGVIIFTPVYHSFISMIKNNKRQLIEHPLRLHEGKYFIDFERLERSMTGRERILLFCSPHNPGGRVWSKDELRRIADFCKKHDLIIISDEIHNDLVYQNSQHIVYPLAAPDILDRLVMLVSSSKTFNIAGGLMGNVIIEDKDLRKKFELVHRRVGTSPNLFGMIIAERAYKEGQNWLKELLSYLDNNKNIFDAGVQQITGLESMKLSATYLAWINFKPLGISDREIIERIHNKARIAASIGSTFGKGGEGFMRFNLACPKAKVLEALERLSLAFKDIK